MSHLDAGVLHELLDGEIPSTELAPIQAHLTACAECRAKLEEERRLLAEADGLVEVLEIPAATETLLKRKPAGRSRTAWPQYVAWAATIVIAAGLGYSARRIPPQVVAHDTVTIASGVDVTADQARVPSTAPADRARSTPGGREERAIPKANPPAAATSQPLRDATRATQQDRRDSVIPPVTVAQGRVAGRPTGVSAPAPLEPPAQKTAAELSANAAAQQVRGVTGDLAGGGRGGVNNLVARDMLAAKSVPIDTITLHDAVQRLGGSLRLIDGLVPLRLEAQGAYVRVVYPSAQGELVLQQQLIDGRVVFQLLPPRGFPADSLGRLRGRVRE